MKSFVMVSFALLFSSIASPAQNATYGVAGMEGLSPAQAANSGISPSQTSVTTLPVFCPVSMRAQHGATGAMLQANKRVPKGPAQLLHLTLINPDSRQIMSARFRVRGVSGRARVTQALSSPGNGDADATRTQEVQFSPAPGNTATGDLSVPGMTAVLTIEISSVTFADGSTRSFTPRDACRVAPDLKMLVANQ